LPGVQYLFITLGEGKNTNTKCINRQTKKQKKKKKKKKGRKNKNKNKKDIPAHWAVIGAETSARLSKTTTTDLSAKGPAYTCLAVEIVFYLFIFFRCSISSALFLFPTHFYEL
jgi:hypothetical protein